MARFRMSRRSSNKAFRKGAKTRRINLSPGAGKRGGTRL